MKKILLLALVVLGGVMQASAYELYLHNQNNSWGAYPAFTNKGYNSNGEEVFEYTLNSTSGLGSGDFYFRLKYSDYGNDLSPYNGGDYMLLTSPDNINVDGYETYTINHNNSFFGNSGAFVIPHSTIKASEYKITVYAKRENIYYLKVEINSAISATTLSGRQYATYVTPAKLNFGAAEGVTAYIATGFNSGKTAIVLSPINVVPAGTPIIIKTDTQGASISVSKTTDDADDVSGNALQAGDGETAWNGTSGYTYYYLASDQFHKATSGTLQKGKAYLKVSTSEAPARLSFIFDEESTGIASLSNNEKNTEYFFNLNGQKVNTPKRGLYIVNGKKVIK